MTDFWAMVFNPSSVDRLSHTLIALVLGAFFVSSVCAYYLPAGGIRSGTALFADFTANGFAL
ncbi:MAG: cytochrome ubiquinol oxidase subunit I [Pirellulaceae bacterium]